MHSAAIELSKEAHRLRPELHDPSDAAAKRHRLHVAAAGFPVGGDDGRPTEAPVLPSTLLFSLAAVALSQLRQESVEVSSGVDVPAHHISTSIDAAGLRIFRPGKIN